MRSRKLKNIDAKLQAATEYIILEPLALQGNFATVVSPQRPLVVEIGSGKGQLLTAAAQANPERAYLGLERDRSIIYKTTYLLARPLPNLKFILADAAQLAEIFLPGTIDELWLSFSDPWPKARHEKRRLTYPTQLKSYQQVLAPGGRLCLKTDNEAFFAYSREMLEANGWRIVRETRDLHAAGTARLTTEYEDKFIAAGQAINYLEAIYEH